MDNQTGSTRDLGQANGVRIGFFMAFEERDGRRGPAVS